MTKNLELLNNYFLFTEDINQFIATHAAPAKPGKAKWNIMQVKIYIFSILNIIHQYLPLVGWWEQHKY